MQSVKPTTRVPTLIPGAGGVQGMMRTRSVRPDPAFIFQNRCNVCNIDCQCPYHNLHKCTSSASTTPRNSTQERQVKKANQAKNEKSIRQRSSQERNVPNAESRTPRKSSQEAPSEERRAKNVTQVKETKNAKNVNRVKQAKEIKSSKCRRSGQAREFQH